MRYEDDIVLYRGVEFRSAKCFERHRQDRYVIHDKFTLSKTRRIDKFQDLISKGKKKLKQVVSQTKVVTFPANKKLIKL